MKESELISPQSFKLIQQSLIFCRFLSFHPLRWNKRSKTLEVSQSTATIVAWGLSMIITFGYHYQCGLHDLPGCFQTSLTRTVVLSTGKSKGPSLDPETSVHTDPSILDDIETVIMYVFIILSFFFPCSDLAT